MEDLIDAEFQICIAVPNCSTKYELGTEDTHFESNRFPPTVLKSISTLSLHKTLTRKGWLLFTLNEKSEIGKFSLNQVFRMASKLEMLILPRAENLE